ncbi:MAG: ATP synthase archaeal subunit H [Methanobacterium sp.]
MMSISEAITTIKKAEIDADKLIEDAKQRSSEMKADAKKQSEALIKSAIEEANKETGDILLKAEEDAKEETNRISTKAEDNIRSIENQAKDKIDEAMDIIVKNVL